MGGRGMSITHYTSTIWIAGGEVLVPIRALLGRSGEEWTAECADQDIHGVDATGDGAIMDLRSALREHLDTLEAEPSLAEHLAAQRDWLRKHLRPRSARVGDKEEGI